MFFLSIYIFFNVIDLHPARVRSLIKQNVTRKKSFMPR